MKRLFRVIVCFIVILFAFEVIFSFKHINYYIYNNNKVNTNIVWQIKAQSVNEKMCCNFVENKLNKEKNGIHTNFLEWNKVEEQSKGHEILSESEGLMMLYYAQMGDEKSFDKHFEIVKNNMLLENNLIKWRIISNNQHMSKSSASIDDLRIIRSVIFAYDRWKDVKYKEFYVNLALAIKNYEINDCNIVDFYDYNIKKMADNITLSYIDLYTMGLISKFDDTWKDTQSNGLNLINKAYISDTFPLYKKTYYYSTQKYSDDKKVNIIDSFIVIEHLSEIGKAKPKTIKWIKDRLNSNGRIYAEYDVKTGKPLTNIESTASYALGAQIAKNLGDKEMYNLMMKRMLRYQVRERNNDLFGAFGDTTKMQAFSFDNLQALMAFQGFSIKK